MKRGPWPPERAERRDHIETAQIVLITVGNDLDEVLTRIRQAIKRSSTVFDVLDPAVERLGSVKADVEQAQKELAELWSDERNDYINQEQYESLCSLIHCGEGGGRRAGGKAGGYPPVDWTDKSALCDGCGGWGAGYRDARGCQGAVYWTHNARGELVS